MKPPAYGDERNDEILAWLRDVHAFAVRVEPVVAAADELLLDAGWRLTADDRFADCAGDLRACLARLGCDLSAAGGRQVCLSCRDTAAPQITVAATGIEIVAATVRDGWRAVVWLQRQMALRHGPLLPLGRWELEPAADLRIATSMYAHGFEDPRDTTAYDDDYLRSMVHHGYSAVFLYLNLWDFCTSKLLPELSSPEASAFLSALRVLADRAGRFGIGLVGLINAPRVAADHPVFRRCPELRGGIVMRADGHALCTSESLTHAFYAEQMRKLCEAVPALAALAFLIGGEGFLHCYTRPVPRTEQVTNCRRCRQTTAAAVLPPLLNAVTAAIKETSPATRVMFWPYSSMLWQHQPKESYDWSVDLAVIQALDPRATWLIEIEKDGVVQIPELGDVSVWDYSIQFIGPSQKMQIELPVLRSRQIELAVKTETDRGVELHALPYLPVMQRWAARRRAIQQTGAAVIWEMWRFMGFWPSPSSELSYWLDLQPELSDEAALSLVARRLYGAAAVPAVLAAWQAFSDAWETVFVLYGFYWAGPMVIGPAQPYDNGRGFSLPNTYSELFYEICPGLRETESEAFLTDPRNLSPRYAFTAEPYLLERTRDLRLAADGYAAGLPHLRQALAMAPPELEKTAQADLDMATMVWIYLESDLGFNAYTQIREGLLRTQSLSPAYRDLLAEAAALLKADIARSEQALEIVRRTPFVSWRYTYGVAFSAAMVEEKLARSRAQSAVLEEWLQHGIPPDAPRRVPV